MVSLWAASGVIKSLIDGFHAAYRVPRSRSIVRQSAVAMALVIVAAIRCWAPPCWSSSAAQVERVVLDWMRGGPAAEPLRVGLGVGQPARPVYALSFVATVAGHCQPLLLRALPEPTMAVTSGRARSWRPSLWLAATTGFAWYARNIAHYNVMYGSIGAVIALLVWMYLMAFIALIGCEFNAEYERSIR